MKKLFSLLLVTSVFVVSGCATISPVTPTISGVTTGATKPLTTEKNVPKRQTYESKTDGFSLQFPGTWTFQENVYGSSVMFYSPTSETDTIKENVGIIKKALNKTYTLEDYYTINKEGLATQSGYNEVENTTIKVDDLDAKKSIFISSLDTTKLKFEQVFIIKNNFVYILTYTATEATFNEYSQKVDDMIASLKIK